ncbi:MAG: L-threonylcarbamoyladenylate synthase [Parasphingorhabdus sp.]|jgi:L-threonylcarbamoyladenylate synthase
MSSHIFRVAARTLRQGGVIGYPTESCYGLGCNPMHRRAAVSIIRLKRRSLSQGLLLVGAHIGHIKPYLSAEAMDMLEEPLQSWPGPFTWLLPASKRTPYWITGGRDCVAVRISANRTIQRLCRNFAGAIVSTSANPHGRPSAKTRSQVIRYFPDKLEMVVVGAIDGNPKPSQIKDARTGTILRAN